MFGKHSLMKDGATAKAVVTEELKEQAIARSESELAAGERSGNARDDETPEQVLERVRTSGKVPTFGDIKVLRDVPGGREVLQAAASGVASAPTPAGSQAISPQCFTQPEKLFGRLLGPVAIGPLGR